MIVGQHSWLSSGSLRNCRGANAEAPYSMNRQRTSLKSIDRLAIRVLRSLLSQSRRQDHQDNARLHSQKRRVHDGMYRPVGRISMSCTLCHVLLDQSTQSFLCGPKFSIDRAAHFHGVPVGNHFQNSSLYFSSASSYNCLCDVQFIMGIESV